MKKWQVVYQTNKRSVQVIVIEVDATDPQSALAKADRLLIAWGDSPERYQRPVWGKNKINTIREIVEEVV